MLNNTRIRLRLLSTILSVGFSLLSLALIVIPFMYSLGWAVLAWGLFLILSLMFLVFGLLTLKNLKREDRLEIQSMFVFTLIAVGFQCLYFNNGPLEWFGFLLLVGIVGVGIKVRSAMVMLEIVNWISLSFLGIMTWIFVSFFML